MFRIVGKQPNFKQWDLDQLVTCDCLKEGDDVVFRSGGKTYETTAFAQDGMVVADVPNFILQKADSFRVDLGWGLKCHLDCRTTFDVEAMEKPEDYVCTENIKQRNTSTVGATKVSALDDFIANTDIAHLYDESTGAYYTVIRVYKQKIDGTYQYPFVYAPNGANAGNKSTLDMTKGDGWLLAINSGVFDTTTRKPDGIVIQNGAVIKKSPTTTHSQCKPLTIDRNGNLGYAEYNADANQLAGNGIVSAVCGFIPIVVDYNAVPQSEWNSVSHYTENAQRQIIGQWGNGDYAIITCEGRGFHNSDGWTIAEAQTICRKHGLKFAYNLDGGGSTETMLGLKPVNTIYEDTTGRIVPTFIVFNGTTTFRDVVVPEPDADADATVCVVRRLGATMHPHIGYGTCTKDSYARMGAVSEWNTPKLPFEINGVLTGEVSNYAPIALPDGAASITIVCPGFVSAVTLWTTDGETWTRTGDPGWMSEGGGTYILPANVNYTHYAVSFKKPDESEITQDTDISGISITVQTVEQPDPDIDFSQMGNLYRLSAETVFSGDDYIDTGVKLNEADVDFTIAFSATPGTQNNEIPQIFNCQKEAYPYPGFCFSCHRDHAYYRLAESDGTNNTIIPKSTTEPFKVVITHKKGTGLYELKHLYNGYVMPGSRNGVTVANTIIDVNFIIGAWQNTDGSKGRYWVGTMHDFFIDDYVWDDAIITEYLK